MNESEQKKITVLLVEPNKYPKITEIEDSLEAMQKIVGGNIEVYSPFNDEVAIICNEEGKMIGLPLNRVIYTEPEMVEMTYQQMKERFREAESGGGQHINGYVVFTEDSFDRPYSEEARTYVISSNNKAFQSEMIGYSVFGSCLDGTDPCARLDVYMSDEHGGKDGWKIERCYMKENSREMIDVISGTFFIVHTPIGSDDFESLPENLAEKYRTIFKSPERFVRTDEGIKAVPFNPAMTDRGR